MSDPLEPVILVGDVLEQLATLPDDSVHCVVTSPPYFGLRDYGTGEWEGGDDACDHVRPSTNMNEGFNERWGQGAGDRKQETKSDGQYPHLCGKCGARRVDRQIGLEPSLDEYLEKMVEVFRGVRRVLRSDGTCWLNIGDSYVSQPAGNVVASGFQQKSRAGQSGALAQFQPQVVDSKRVNGEGTAMRPPGVDGLKQKDLMMVPARLALALQADGWWIRSDIIWSKPNPMPESIRDRPTSAHEHLFLLTKSPRYFYDQEAVREPQTPDGRRQTTIASNGAGVTTHENYEGRQGGERWPNEGGRNMRNVWTIATEPYPDAHFATFPTKLVEPCILAGTSEEGCCPECGAPWDRDVERKEYGGWHDHAADIVEGASQGGALRKQVFRDEWEPPKTVAWSPSCICGEGGHFAPVPCTVLDPFAGSGTTLLVARRLNRASLGIELNPEYAALAGKRLERWWEKPSRTRDDVVEGQLGLEIL